MEMSLASDARPVVCQVLHSLCMGGAEVLAARLARNLRDEFQFVFACLDEAGFLAEELNREGFPVHVFQRKSGFDRRLATRLGRMFRAERVQVIHAHQYAPFFYSSIARGWFTGRPVLFTEHGRHQPDYPRRKRIWANRLLLKGRDRVVAVGEAVRQALIQNEGLPPARVEVVYNGVDLSRFDPAAPARGAVRRELGLQDNDFALFQVARLDYLKDHETALRMMAELEPTEHAVMLLIVGDGPERSKLEALCNDLNLRDRVRFLGLRTDVDRLLQAGDAVLLTSLSEGIPLTLIEGMAAGLPILATDVGGVAEVVEQQVTGLLAPAREPKRLAESLRRLAADREECRKWGAAGRRRSEELFSEPRMASAYRNMYSAMVGIKS